MEGKEGTTRPPVVVVMGHVDHGKSKLLDYIRSTNVVDGEAGGITQHVAAYEVEHPDDAGISRKITFIDTPGHAAFQAMRTRCAELADIAILIISAEDSVKEQTKEAYETIKKCNMPFIVAINMIDKPGANPVKVKTDLSEIGVYVEGFGGNISVVEISAKQGTNINDLLSLILLQAELEELTGSTDESGKGLVIESHMDAKRGTAATMIIKDGTVKRGDFIVSGNSFSKAVIFEDFKGNSLEVATFSSPITIYGFSKTPSVGNTFYVVKNKKDAEKAIKEYEANHAVANENNHEGVFCLPLIIKADVIGSAEALRDEISKLDDDRIHFKVLSMDCGEINESDIKLALSDENTIILGFHVDVEKQSQDLAEQNNITVKTSDIIYKLTEWLEEMKTQFRPKVEVENVLGNAKILKIFSTTKNKTVLGGKVKEGSIKKGGKIKIVTKEEEFSGEILNLQKARQEVGEVNTGEEFGAMIESEKEISVGDTIVSFENILD